jgi:hypothetical protein
LFESLKEAQPFSLDDMSRTMVSQNLATSSGYMGEQALERSTRADRSRDPLYNQSKMYSELYRTLGWLHPLPNNRLNFTFTFLGAHVAAARRDPDSIFRESVLGIAYPNSILEVLGNYHLRPFACILRTISALDGFLCRDEMIVGSLTLENDKSAEGFNSMVQRVRALRGDYRRLDAALNEVSRTRGITLVTMGNYTRFPLAVLEWSGWTVKERRRNVYGKPYVFHVLTEEGREQVEWINSALDLRASDLTDLDAEVANALIRYSFYKMLERSGFDILSVADEISKDATTFQPVFGERVLPVLFSPFQELAPDTVQPLFPLTYTPTETAESAAAVSVQPQNVVPNVAEAVNTQITLSYSKADISQQITVELPIVQEIRNAGLQFGKDISQVTEHLATSYQTANKDVFYPLVANLFCAINYQCEVTRGGVNYQRWDAFITDPEQSIPIEIKSPGEELFISVKAVRQALENKVIFLSRRPYPTQENTTSLVVGFNPPNERAAVATLIEDIYQTFNISVGVIDFRSLLKLVVSSVLEQKEHNKTQLQTLRGIINVSNT